MFAADNPEQMSAEAAEYLSAHANVASSICRLEQFRDEFLRKMLLRILPTLRRGAGFEVATRAVQSSWVKLEGNSSPPEVLELLLELRKRHVSISDFVAARGENRFSNLSDGLRLAELSTPQLFFPFFQCSTESERTPNFGTENRWFQKRELTRAKPIEDFTEIKHELEGLKKAAQEMSAHLARIAKTVPEADERP